MAENNSSTFAKVKNVLNFGVTIGILKRRITITIPMGIFQHIQKISRFAPIYCL